MQDTEKIRNFFKFTQQRSGRAGLYSQAVGRCWSWVLTPQHYVHTASCPHPLNHTSTHTPSLSIPQEMQTDSPAPLLTDHPCCKCHGAGTRDKRFQNQQDVASARRCSWSGLGEEPGSADGWHGSTVGGHLAQNPSPQDRQVLASM